MVAQAIGIGDVFSTESLDLALGDLGGLALAWSVSVGVAVLANLARCFGRCGLGNPVCGRLAWL